jgi:membrane protein DedA with SNARE-associated domain
MGSMRGKGLQLLLLITIACSIFAAFHFAVKSYRSYKVLDFARTLDVPEAGDIRGWMSLQYIASSYQTPLDNLLQQLKLPTDMSQQSLATLARAENSEPLLYVQKVQRALAELAVTQPQAMVASREQGWFEQFTQQILSALLLYGYPVLGVILFLGALGLPLPAGPLMAITGSLALQGEINWVIACSIALGLSVAGDLTGYVLGRRLTPQFLDEWGHWVGYTPANRERVERLFDRWGGLTLVVTRSIMAHVAVLASILAGAGRYQLGLFLLYSGVGRLIWTAAYFGVGYTAGTHIEVASGFLGYISLLLIFSATLIGATIYLNRIRVVAI